jgi:lipoate-protein ligase B
MICKSYYLGLLEYQKAVTLQKELSAKIISGKHPPALLLLEHPHTYTFGSRGQAENLLWNEDELERRGITVHWTDRGGDVTYHGPGQLVGYPLIPLGKAVRDSQGDDRRVPQVDYIAYLRKLEEVIILLLSHLGIPAGQIRGQTGVWLMPDVVSRCKLCPPHMRKQPAKIASIGIKVDAHGISRHGFSLNVAPDMNYWQGILACGLKNQNQISLEYFLESIPDMDTIAKMTAKAFGGIFGFQIV